MKTDRKRKVAVKFESRHHGPNTSNKGLKGILKDEGFSDQEIEIMRSENRILLVPQHLRIKLREGLSLVVIERGEHVKYQKISNRFDRLEID